MLCSDLNAIICCKIFSILIYTLPYISAPNLAYTFVSLFWFLAAANYDIHVEFEDSFPYIMLPYSFVPDLLFILQGFIFGIKLYIQILEYLYIDYSLIFLVFPCTHLLCVFSVTWVFAAWIFFWNVVCI